MPIQAPQWTDYLNCPVCCREFGAPPRSPISLNCGHTVCKHCLGHLHRRQCPFDQTLIEVEPEELVVNTALLQLAGFPPPSQPYHPPCIQALSEQERHAYDVIVRRMEELATYLKYCGNAANSVTGGRLSRPMQRKLVTLVQCGITDEEGRGRAARAARSLGERTVTELILQHQNPQQLSANLWAAVRARGCQFLGPAMQEEVLKLVLLALEDGSALSRKVLVMFVVQRLEPDFPQASKTSIGHVVQLLYRASCFKVSKRECDSSLMQLKEEFRTYEALRREHDAQIVQIATEAGLRIAPDQWSALLYGDTAHKSHMQSIIDKLQTPQSFAQSVQELFIALQRTGDPAQLVAGMSSPLDRLAGIDASPDAKSPTWQQLAEILTSLKKVVAGLVHYLQQQSLRDPNHNQKNTERSDISNSQVSPQSPVTPTHGKYKVSMCWDTAVRQFCPRGEACTFAHSEEELERYRYGTVQPPLASPLMVPATNGSPSLLGMNPRIPPPSTGRMPMPPLNTHMSLRPQVVYPVRMPVNYNVPVMSPPQCQQCPTEHQELPQSQMQSPPNVTNGQQQMNGRSPMQNGMRIAVMDQGNVYESRMMGNVPYNRHPNYPTMPVNQQNQTMPANYQVPTTAYIPNRQIVHTPSMTNASTSQTHQMPMMASYNQVHMMNNVQGHPGNMPTGNYSGAVSQNMYVPIQRERTVPSRNSSPYTQDELQSDLFMDIAVGAGRYGMMHGAPSWYNAENVFNIDGINVVLPTRNNASTDEIYSPNDALNNNNTDNELEEQILALERRLDYVLDK